MRIALLYPPPWKIPARGEALAPPNAGGPPANVSSGDLDPDFFQTPYGLFTLGAQAIRAGHSVKVFNLSGFPWTHVEHIVASLDADVWGMSCWTANRRGVAMTAEAIRRLHPRAHIVVGGPHATPLAREMLAHHAAIDTVCLGESEATFMELLGRIERGESTQGLAGTVYRANGSILQGAERESIHDLDTLASPHAYFDTHILMTARGCPWACTFCGADTTWGRGFRGHSVPFVLDELEQALSRLPVKMLQIKDDTFTTSKKRVLELCRGIRARGLKFEWSCDTRVDVLGEELLREMRLAGCERLSLGVESGSAAVLKAIDKKITVDEIVASTEMAKRVGIQVRYYMMIGNRGETRETFQETLDFLSRAKPHQYLFSCLSFYPGTRDFHDAEASGRIHREQYFTGTFQELKLPFDAGPEDAAWMDAWFVKNKGLRKGYDETVDGYRAILARLGEHWGARLDLGAALYRENKLDEAEEHVQRALELGHPLPGLVHNHLACIALARGNVEMARVRFARGVEVDPQHALLLRNVQAFADWLAADGPDKGVPLRLEARHDFQLLERTTQPTLPGPLPQDFAAWTVPEGPRVIAPIRPEEIAAPDARRRLALLGQSRP